MEYKEDNTLPKVLICNAHGTIVSDTVTYGAIQGPAGGSISLSFSHRDILAVKKLKDNGVNVYVLASNMHSIEHETLSVISRTLGVEMLYGVFEDGELKKRFVHSRTGLDGDDIAYVGSDTTDLEMLYDAVDSFIPRDASKVLIDNADKTCSTIIDRDGGKGVLEEIVDNIYKL